MPGSATHLAQGELGDVADAIDGECLAALEVDLAYACQNARHTERRHIAPVNFWRDVFPPGLDAALMGKRVGDKVSLSFKAGTLVPGSVMSLVRQVRRADFDSEIVQGLRLEPDVGRFLPLGVLHRCGIGGIYRDNRKPFRVLRASGNEIEIDRNHPFAGVDAVLTARVLAIGRKEGDRGGRCQDWAEVLTDGPGIQFRADAQPTEFFVRDWAARADPSDDAGFYASPRLVAHLDQRAASVVRELYGREFRGARHVLDFMSSAHSHLPEGAGFTTVTGLGMNAAELAANPALTERIVHDLNATPRLPFADAVFDAAICTVSIEYLTRPQEIVEEVARVLRPGSPFVVTFSNRWFPPKAIAVWIAAHPYERIGMVLEWMLKSGRFDGLETLVVRGYPRPTNDPHIGETQESDPIFAVWGRRKG